MSEQTPLPLSEQFENICKRHKIGDTHRSMMLQDYFDLLELYPSIDLADFCNRWCKRKTERFNRRPEKAISHFGQKKQNNWKALERAAWLMAYLDYLETFLTGTNGQYTEVFGDLAKERAGLWEFLDLLGAPGLPGAEPVADGQMTTADVLNPPPAETPPAVTPPVVPTTPVLPTSAESAVETKYPIAPADVPLWAAWLGGEGADDAEPRGFQVHLTDQIYAGFLAMKADGKSPRYVRAALYDRTGTQLTAEERRDSLLGQYTFSTPSGTYVAHVLQGEPDGQAEEQATAPTPPA